MLKPKQVAERLNVTVKTLQRWDREGVLKAKRTPTNRRYYTEQMLEDFLNGGQARANLQNTEHKNQ